jgi:hypothetical protein
MSPKQEIYGEMLRLALPWIRNVSTWPWWRRCRDRSTFYESELIHNLSVSMFEPDFVDHDIWILNHQAKVYHDQCTPRRSPNYVRQVELIGELFTIVPDALRTRLNWGGPGPADNAVRSPSILGRY